MQWLGAIPDGHTSLCDAAHAGAHAAELAAAARRTAHGDHAVVVDLAGDDHQAATRAAAPGKVIVAAPSRIVALLTGDIHSTGAAHRQLAGLQREHAAAPSFGEAAAAMTTGLRLQVGLTAVVVAVSSAGIEDEGVAQAALAAVAAAVGAEGKVVAHGRVATDEPVVDQRDLVGDQRQLAPVVGAALLVGVVLALRH